jgi:hypothetical protein
VAGVLAGMAAAAVNTAINGGNFGYNIGMGALFGGLAGPSGHHYLGHSAEFPKWTETMVSSSQLKTALQTYVSEFVGKPYNPFTPNSNYFVNYVISNSGGNPNIPGAFAPQCVPQCPPLR